MYNGIGVQWVRMMNASLNNCRETGVLEIVLEHSIKEAEVILWRTYVVF